MASVLGRRLAACGIPIAAVLSRRLGPARDLADRVEAAVASTAWSDLPRSVRVVFLCVPDDAIGSVAEALSEVPHAWDETRVAHTSGALSAAELAALAHVGAQTFSFHPMQTLTPESSPHVLQDIVVGIEGDSLAVDYGEQLARRVGAIPVRLSTDEKVRYHAAAVLASNGLVALMGAATEMLETAGIDSDTARRMLTPLLQQTVANLSTDAPERVLTGPAVRGDVGTIHAHLQAVDAHGPALRPLYVALSNQMLRLAASADRLPQAQRDAVRAVWASDASSSSTASG